MKKFSKYHTILLVLVLVFFSLAFINEAVAQASNVYNFELGSRDLRYGDEGVDIVSLQIQLRVLGFYEGEIDGLFGRGTVKAVEEFQRKNNLDVNGIVDENIYRYLDLSNYAKLNEFARDKIMTLARAINGEARGESFRGQVGVGAVILNRVESDEFADTIKEVIYKKGQFTSVINGQVNLSPTESSIKAAKAALLGYDPTGNARFFYNPVTATKLEWISSRPKIVKIDNHIFAD
ncbi:cell wall hydrolase [Sporohalobacter salinus]|uniref:cell wall hydrolase n=1 Tax=Sporohalobacter salinus TaxID=1494606 RepID=UPI00195FAA00|nr:cell wall hydrolase [Sporohalobacter salinus]MBM7624674.1 N-acetylmuramoyl-L-alanine amidase [Sporohalobacter salinus]